MEEAITHRTKANSQGSTELALKSKLTTAGCKELPHSKAKWQLSMEQMDVYIPTNRGKDILARALAQQGGKIKHQQGVGVQVPSEIHEARWRWSSAAPETLCPVPQLFMTLE